MFSGLVKYDTLTGREEWFQFEPGVFCSEVGVAPRVGGTEEDDAYLVTLTVEENRDLSECIVFRANDVGRGRSRALSSPSGSRVARTAAGRLASPYEAGEWHPA